ncbi:MAG: TonB family protein [Myxococcales bacterium]|nr:TonB family protein [Myxococcales bacterium]MCB9702865.1 TonB family protein [Myxococcales bacterium]
MIAAEPGGPVDLSDGAFVSGEGSAYAGGVTTSSGRGKTPGGRGAAPATKPAAPPPKRPAPTKVISEDRSSPVRLRPEEWICAWPREAIDEPLDEEVVVLKVLVGGDGAVEDARLVRDPGRGFGRAALSCARGTRFEPARDRQGEAIRAWSPPIRVRFYR